MSTNTGALNDDEDRRETWEPRADVAFVPLPLLGFAGRLASLYCAGALIGAGWIYFVHGNGHLAAVFALFGVVLGTCALSLERTLTRECRKAYGLRATPIPIDAPRDELIGRYFFKNMPSMSSFRLLRDRGQLWNGLQDAAIRTGVSLPPSVADNSVAPMLQTIPLIDDLIEPEFIAPSLGQSREQRIVAIAGLAIIILLTFRSGNYMILLPFSMVIALGVVGSARFRKWFPALRMTANAPIAAPGIVRDRRRRDWTRGSAVMVVQKGHGHGVIWVTFTGSIGILRMSFPSIEDADFINLWQRWNHPHPRPELLTE